MSKFATRSGWRDKNLIDESKRTLYSAHYLLLTLRVGPSKNSRPKIYAREVTDCTPKCGRGNDNLQALPRPRRKGPGCPAMFGLAAGSGGWVGAMAGPPGDGEGGGGIGGLPLDKSLGLRGLGQRGPKQRGSNFIPRDIFNSFDIFLTFPG